MLPDRALQPMPSPARRRVQDVFDAMKVARRVENKKVLVDLAPSVARGLLLKEGKQGEPVGMRASHEAWFDFRYGDHLCQATYPLESLKNVTLVDTPGTNSIILEHAALTESFVHRAELVLFITSSDHPFTESERQFLQFLKGKWGRKVLFILNKIDLKSPEELNEIVSFLEKNYYRLLGFEPKILLVSAKEAYKAKVENDIHLLEKSRIREVESFIFDSILTRRLILSW